MNTQESTARGTDTSSAKRIRIETPTVPSHTIASPAAAAKAVFVNGTLALPLALQDTVKGEARNYIELLKTLRSKETSLKKYDDESYIPLSLRKDFKLKGSFRITKSSKFEEHQKEMDEITKEWRLKARKKTKEILMMDIEAFREELIRIGIRITRLICQAELLQRMECRDPDLVGELAANVIKDGSVDKILFHMDQSKAKEKFLPISDKVDRQLVRTMNTLHPYMETNVRRNVIGILIACASQNTTLPLKRKNATKKWLRWHSSTRPMLPPQTW